MKKILVPLDFSEHSKVVYQFALEMAKKMSASLCLYHTAHLPFNENTRTLEYGDTLEKLTDANRYELQQLIEKNTPLQYSGVQVNTKIEVGFPVEGILKAANDLPAELVIMGMRNKNLWDDFLFGSVTEGVLKKMKRPILVVPPKYEYQAPDQMLYIFHYGYTDLKNLQLMSGWAKNWNASLHSVLVASQDVRQKGIKEIKEKLLATCINVYQATFSSSIQKSDFRKELSTYIGKHNITLLVMEHHDKVLQKLMHRVKDMGIVRHLHLPVLFLPHKNG